MPGLQVYFSPDELRALEHAAEARGEPLNRVIREACVASLQGKPEVFQAKTRALQSFQIASIGLLCITSLLSVGFGSL